MRSKSSRTKAIKTKKRRRVFFLCIYSKQDPLDVIHRLARVSNFFMALEKSTAGILFSWSVTAFWISWIVSNLAPFSCNFTFGEQEVVGGRQIWRVWGVIQCCDLFLSQKVSNFCCWMRQGVFVSSNLLKSIEPQFSGCRVYLLLTKMTQFDLLWPFFRRRQCCHRFDLLRADHCVRHPSLTLYPLETVCATRCSSLTSVSRHWHRVTTTVSARHSVLATTATTLTPICTLVRNDFNYVVQSRPGRWRW